MACYMLLFGGMLVKDHNDSEGERPENDGSHPACEDFTGLEAWLVKQYKQAVDTHRNELSQQVGRCVGWFEAERDFFENDCFGLPEKWRQEYCGLMCAHKNSCLLALHFLMSSEESRISRVG